ncbi:hypothetical protein V1517DRAFT_319655 [Lipomyces orientalis]|uniref:Uncharacterized protein n=1 Tax=Lipomyces orientalis TaxID=1233043 RepID=A0ACC3TR84_9ASCO
MDYMKLYLKEKERRKQEKKRRKQAEERRKQRKQAEERLQREQHETQNTTFVEFIECCHTFLSARWSEKDHSFSEP